MLFAPFFLEPYASILSPGAFSPLSPFSILNNLRMSPFHLGVTTSAVNRLAASEEYQKSLKYAQVASKPMSPFITPWDL